MRDTRPHMLVIDGSSLLTTCFYATLPPEIRDARTDEEKAECYKSVLQTSDGIYTNGILGFVRYLTNYIRECHPAYVVTAFDKSRDTFRRKLYSDYKAQRGATPVSLKPQFMLMEQILSESNIPVFLSDSFEADDLAGSIGEKYRQKCQVSYLTKDRDYLQLVHDDTNTKCFIMSDYKKAKEFREQHGYLEPEEHSLRNLMIFDESAVYGEKGVLPKNIVDLKAIDGDASDNIPGVKGVSATTAVPLINKYGNVDAIYDEINKIKEDPKQQKQLAAIWKESLGISRSPLKAFYAGEESARLSKELATIKTTLPIPDLDDFSVSNINKEVFNRWMERLQIQNIRM